MEISIFAKRAILSTVILGGIFMVFACSPAPSVVTTLVPMDTATGTKTLIPTETHIPSPTVTVQPSATPPPTATPTPLIADHGQVIFSENFDNLDFPFNVYGPKRIENGTLVLDETPPDQQANVIYGTLSIPPDATTIVLFKTNGATTFNIGYHVGDYGTDSLRRFSFNSASGTWDKYVGNPDSKSSGNYPVQDWNGRQIEFDRWCYFSLTRTADGSIDARIWERDKPETTFRFQGNLGSEWGSFEFTFFVDFRLGSFILDEYQELK